MIEAIETEEDYQTALEEIGRLMDKLDKVDDLDNHDELDALTTLIEQYEASYID